MSLRALTGLVAYCHGHSFNELWPPYLCHAANWKTKFKEAWGSLTWGGLRSLKRSKQPFAPGHQNISFAADNKETIWRTSMQLRYLLHTAVKVLNPWVIPKVGWVWSSGRLNVVLNRTVVDRDWRFDDLCGSHFQSQIELYHVSWWYYTLVIDLIGQFTPDVIGRLSAKPWRYWLWRLVM